MFEALDHGCGAHHRLDDRLTALRHRSAKRLRAPALRERRHLHVDRAELRDAQVVHVDRGRPLDRGFHADRAQRDRRDVAAVRAPDAPVFGELRRVLALCTLYARIDAEVAHE
jgi:hypothetical protein